MNDSKMREAIRRWKQAYPHPYWDNLSVESHTHLHRLITLLGQLFHEVEDGNY